MDLTRRSAGKWIVDFGWEITESESRALRRAPFVTFGNMSIRCVSGTGGSPTE